MEDAFSFFPANIHAYLQYVFIRLSLNGSTNSFKCYHRGNTSVSKTALLILKHRNLCVCCHGGGRVPSRNQIRLFFDKKSKKICFLDMQTVSGVFFLRPRRASAATATSSVAVIPCDAASRGELIGGLGERMAAQEEERRRGRPCPLWGKKNQSCDKLMSPLLLYIPFQGCSKDALMVFQLWM